MKAAYYEKYGDPKVIDIREIPKPEPKANELLVKVISTTVNSADARIRSANFPKGFTPFARLAFGIFKPRNNVLGNCFSGVVENVGEKVDQFKIGDEVCGMTGIKMKAHAEYIVIDQSKAVARKPESVTHDEAASVLFGGTTALSFLKGKVGLKQGQDVLINGASGSVGTNAVQIAKYLGAKVTGVTSSKNKKLVSTLGADHIIDYTIENFLDSSTKYDVVFDTVGNISIKDGKRILANDGKLILAVASLGEILVSSFSKNVIASPVSERKEDIELLLSLVEQKKLRAVIDKTYSLADIIKAHQHVDTGRKVGNVVVNA